MSDIRRNADRNRAIQAMMTDGEQLKAFYRFVANNPHIALHDACQIVIERPNASVCFSFEEWNAQGRRVTKGRKGIPYYDSDGNKYFVFDVADTHGENRYRRITQPVKKILDGLDLVNGTEIADSNRGDYRIMLSGVVNYLGQNEFFTEDEDRNRLIAEGVTYLLYSTTGFPKDRGITLKGYPYGLSENADLFREILKTTEVLQQDINDAVLNKQSEVPVIDDTEEETVTDEPVIPKTDEEQPDYVGEIDTRFPITDDYGDEEDEPDEEDWNEVEESDYNEDEETVDYDYEEEKQAKKEEKSEKKGRPIWERRNKPSRQKSFFDELEPKTAEEELTEYIFCFFGNEKKQSMQTWKTRNGFPQARPKRGLK